MKPRVLLVDDLPEDREIYVDGLRSMGFDILVASCTEALAASTNLRPTVIVLHLDAGNHWQLCDDFRVATPHVPVIVLTAAVRPDHGNRKRARSTVNCAAFVGKPCTHTELAAVIARVARGEREIEMTTGEYGEYG